MNQEIPFEKVVQIIGQLTLSERLIQEQMQALLEENKDLKERLEKELDKAN